MLVHHGAGAVALERGMAGDHMVERGAERVDVGAEIDVDIAAEGIGITVEAYDVAGWERAFRQMSSDPDAAQEMGARGRTVAEQSWNSERFGQGIASIFESL